MIAPGAPRWHTLSPDAVTRLLHTAASGLGAEAARARLARDGPNALPSTPPRSAWAVLAAQFATVVTWLLIGATAVAWATGDRLEAAAIAVVLVLNAGLGFATELRARRAIEALARLEPRRALVRRDGRDVEIDATHVVCGDVVVLGDGQAVPADGRLLHTDDLATDESLLTGESQPVAKDAARDVPDDAPLPERGTMVYAGTMVVGGAGLAVVTATAGATELGRLGTLLATIPVHSTTLERQLDRLGRHLVVVSLAVVALVVALGTMRGLPPLDMLLAGLALAIAAVPEGLPAVATIALARSAHRMARRHALTRRLSAVESLGAVTLICTDKTGTLTSGVMTAVRLWVAGRDVAVSGTGYEPIGVFDIDGTPVHAVRDPALLAALTIGALAGRGDVVATGTGWAPRGDPTDVALLVAARKAGLDRPALIAAWPEIGAIPFSSARRFMATVHRAADGRTLAYVKGAPGRVLDLCSTILTPRGREPLDAERRSEVRARNSALAASGARVLALASGPVARADEASLDDLTFIGLVALSDPPAPGVAEAIAEFQACGIRTVMLTGDQHPTAAAVAHEIGLAGADHPALDGRAIAALDDAALDGRLARTAVFSRLTPDDKLRLVRAWQRQGEVVAFFGDGVNDAAGLRQADVGVTMGARGSDVAREAADVVLEDDRFPTIAAGIEEGRIVFDNIRKFVFFLFSCNAAEVMVFFATSLAGTTLPLRPLQLLWLNLVTDTLPALALALEPGDPNVMTRPPRDPREAILARRFVARIAGYAGAIGAVTLAAFAYGATRWGAVAAETTTLTFTTLALAQVLHLGNARGMEATIGRRAWTNPVAIAAVAASALLQVAAVTWPPLAAVLGTTGLPASAWLVAGLLAAAPAIGGQALRIVGPGKNLWPAAKLL